MNQDEADFGEHHQPLGPIMPIVERPVNHRSIIIFFGILSTMFLTALAAFLLSLGNIRETTDRMNSSSNLKMIGLALHNYADSCGALPTNSYSPDGQPLLSWRVHILPFVEADTLYRQFHYDEPWDSPHNRQLLPLMPRIYENRRANLGRGFTNYRSFQHPGAVMELRCTSFVSPFNAPHGVGFEEFPRSLGNTILVVEAAEPVEWTKPDDLSAPVDGPFPPLFGDRRHPTLYLTGDGEVHYLTHPHNFDDLFPATLYKAELP